MLNVSVWQPHGNSRWDEWRIWNMIIILMLAPSRLRISHGYRCSPATCSSWMEPVLELSATRILTRRVQDSLTERVSVDPRDNIRSTTVARRTAGQMILSQASDESSRLSISYVRIHKHAKNAEGERQRFRAWYHMNLLGRSYACLWEAFQPGNCVSRITWIRKAGIETGGGIIGLIGRPPWFFARGLQRYSQVEKVEDCWFRGDVAGAPERLLGSRHDATALQGWKRNPIAENLPPPFFRQDLPSHPQFKLHTLRRCSCGESQEPGLNTPIPLLQFAHRGSNGRGVPNMRIMGRYQPTFIASLGRHPTIQLPLCSLARTIGANESNSIWRAVAMILYDEPQILNQQDQTDCLWCWRAHLIHPTILEATGLQYYCPGHMKANATNPEPRQNDGIPRVSFQTHGEAMNLLLLGIYKIHPGQLKMRALDHVKLLSHSAP